MTTLFSIAFTGLFVAFVAAAVVGHAFCEALLRPFFGKLASEQHPRRATPAPASR